MEKVDCFKTGYLS